MIDLLLARRRCSTNCELGKPAGRLSRWKLVDGVAQLMNLRHASGFRQRSSPAYMYHSGDRQHRSRHTTEHVASQHRAAATTAARTLRSYCQVVLLSAVGSLWLH